MLQAADLGLFHLHRAQFDTLVDRNASDMVDDPLAVPHASFAQLIVCFAGCRNRLVGIRKNPVASGMTAAGDRRRRANLGQHLGDNITNEYFVDLHGYSSVPVGPVCS